MKNLLLVGLLSFNALSAPFGFEWGQSKSDLIKQGVMVNSCEMLAMEVCMSSTAPESWSKSDGYYLVFYNDALVKVTTSTAKIKNDIYGLEGKRLYNNIKSALIKKYKVTNEFEATGMALYDESDEFYQCLKYDGCGNYVSFMSSDDGEMVMLKIVGVRRGTGYISLGYESNEFKTAKSEMVEKQKQKDASVF